MFGFKTSFSRAYFHSFHWMFDSGPIRHHEQLRRVAFFIRRGACVAWGNSLCSPHAFIPCINPLDRGTHLNLDTMVIYDWYELWWLWYELWWLWYNLWWDMIMIITTLHILRYALNSIPLLLCHVCKWPAMGDWTPIGSPMIDRWPWLGG